MSDQTDITSRIVALEVNQEAIKEGFLEHRESLQRINDNVADIVSRLDRWNGAIPDMAAAISKLNDKFDSFKDSNLIQTATIKTRLKVVWGVLCSVGALVIGVVGKILLGSP